MPESTVRQAMAMDASDTAVATGLRGVRLAILALALVSGCGESPEPPPASAAADGWHEFAGSWVAAGSRRTIALGGDRFAAVTDLTGTLLLAGRSTVGTGFRAEAIALNDSATGLVGRAVWTDERGEQVFSAIEGQGNAAGNRITGTFLGGTGRYAGASGSYEFSWQYVFEAEDGSVQGRAVALKGRVRFASVAPGGAKP